MTGTGGARSRMLIGGEWVPAASGATFAVWDPATGDRLADVADAGSADVRAAIAAAGAARESWRDTVASDRYATLQRAVAILRDRQGRIADLIVGETGKPLAEARGEIANSLRFFDFFSHEALRLPGEYWPRVQEDRDAYVVHEPVGVVAAITPWNFPAFMVACKVGAALAAGCAVVLKPAEQTPLTALAIAEAFVDAGLPAGVLSVVPTSDPAAIGEVLLEHPEVACLTFTGSTAVGQRLLAGAAGGVKRMLLELGGNAPVIITDDVEVDAVVRHVVRARYANAGQACVAANRVYVHQGVADRFVERFTDAVRGLRVGDPWDAATDIGPLIDRRAVETLEDQIARALAGGASLVAGGRRVRDTATSAFLEPGVLTSEGGIGVFSEEFFGPIASVVVVQDDDEAVRRANDTTYGLSAYVFSGDEGRGRLIADRVRSGNVGVNCALTSDPALPFGGVRMSGIGRERGRAGVLEFLESKTIQIARR
ncbi:NAD-dependent succinate-semialdehyde dehydrogenase [Microbacterium resistens]|uniref:aldehyde dehydrogenase family protein n=1 Tax=Microbacterium resistens TaxID=156977 RepID=UPI001C58FED2|nr:NAD-dependent succinate-semialdehyde dehydrogenase [Microbacterium resistens]MBW1640437.1 NAD-dependent succinate-semialdehyde dehydrogenase [Microbacterium resistens]